MISKDQLISKLQMRLLMITLIGHPRKNIMKINFSKWSKIKKLEIQFNQINLIILIFVIQFRRNNMIEFI